MVGVAGKSKGCGTCRRRKVKCDESRPICSRCRKADITCDGYARYPVFIDRSQTGYRKRRPLEEVKTVATPSLIHSPEAESQPLIAWFCATFDHALPSQHNVRTRPHWLTLVATQGSLHPALQTALLAASYVKWADVESEPSIRHNGRALYHKSLRLTRKATLNALDAVSDDILATACVMTLYELSDPTSQSLDSWLRHFSGVGNLIRLRGPSGFTRPASRAIFEHMRYIFMVSHLISRTSSVFGQTEWLDIPWAGVVKPVEQRVFDQGLRLANLLEPFDTVQFYDHPRHKALLHAAIDIFKQIDRLDRCADMNITQTQISPAVGSSSASSLLYITAAGVQLCAATIIHTLRYIAYDDKFELPEFVDPILDISAEADRICKLRTDLARRILQSVQAMRETEVGALGALNMMWSLKIANEQFRPAASEAGHCREMLVSLSRKASLFNGLGNASSASDLS